MKAWKRWLCALLILVLTTQYSAGALADDGKILSEAEVASAMALAGMNEDSAAFMKGMAFSAQMNAKQMEGWLDDLIDEEIASLQHVFTELETTLYDVKVNAPEQYQQLVEGENSTHYQAMKDAYVEVEKLRQELRFYRDRLAEKAGVINTRGQAVLDENATLSDKLTASRQIEEAEEVIRGIRSTMEQHAEEWETRVDDLCASLLNTSLKRMANGENHRAWVQDIMRLDREKPIQQTVSASTMHSNGNKTMLARLAPVQSALAASSETVTISVMDKDTIVFILRDQETGLAIEGATVSVRNSLFAQYYSSDKTEFDGDVMFDSNGLLPNASADIELDITVAAQDYCGFMSPKVTLQKGEIHSYYLKKATDKPYVYTASYNGYDILNEEYQSFFSIHNNSSNTIQITTDKDCSVTLRYRDTNDNEVKTSTLKSTASNSHTVKWKTQWKKMIKPNTTVTVLLEDSSGNVVEQDLKLKMVKGVTDMPLTDPSAITQSFPGFGFSYVFPNSLAPFAGSSIGIDVPWEQVFTARFVLNLDGSFLYAIGLLATDIAKEYTDNWKSNDQKQLDYYNRENEREMAKALSDSFITRLCEEKKIPFLRAFKLNFGVFMMAMGREGTGQWGLSDNYGMRGSIAIGASLIFSASFTWYFAAMVTLNVTVSLGVSVTVHFDFESIHDAEHHGTRFFFDKSGLTIQIRIQITLSLCIGVKDVLSVTITGYAYFLVVIDVHFDGNTYLSLYWGAGASIVIQFLVFKYTFTIWDSGMQLLTSTDPSKYQAKSLPWYETLLTSAKAEESDLPEDDGGSVATTPDSYDALEPKLDQLLDTVMLDSPNLRFIEMDGTTYVFYIAPAANGKPSALTWINLKTKKSYTIDSTFMPHSLHDYSFDVQSQPCITEFNDHVNSYYKNRDIGVLAVASTTGFTEKKVTSDGKERIVKLPKDTTLTYIIFVYDKNSDKFSMNLVARDNQWSTANSFYSTALSQPLGNVQLGMYQVVNLQVFPNIVVQAVLDDAIGEKNKLEHAELVYSITAFGHKDTRTQEVLPKIEKDVKTVTLLDLDHHPGSDSPWKQIVVADKTPHSDFGNLMNCMYFLKDGVITRKDLFSMPIAEGNISFFQVLPDRQNQDLRTVFYLDDEVPDAGIAADGETYDGQQGVIHHLKAASVKYDWAGDGFGRQLNVTISNVDLDVEVPTNNFQVEDVDGDVFIYWMETAPKENKDDPDVYYLRAVDYEPETQACSDDFVLAQMTAKNNSSAPAHIFLSRAGKGYYTQWQSKDSSSSNSGAASICSFSVSYISHMDLKALSSAEYLVKAGSDVDMYLSLMNDGNIMIKEMNFEVVLMDNDGKIIQKDGKDDVVERLHVDLLHPENSSRVVTGDAASTTHGECAIYRLDDNLYTPVQSRFNVTRQVTTYTNYWQMGAQSSNRTVYEPVTEAVHSKSLLPGQLTTLKAAIHIPASWKMGKKNVVIRLPMAQSNALGEEEDKEYEKMDSSSQGIDVSHRVFTGLNGEDYLAITIYNHAETGDDLRLYAEVYLDDDQEPMYVDLPYYPNYTSVGKTHTLEMPVSALLNGRSAWRAVVTVKAAGVKETLKRDNEFVLYLSASAPLRVLRQPADYTALKGETATFSVQAEGGAAPYTYQWQKNAAYVRGWQDIPDATDSMLKLENVGMEESGTAYRCAVTDHNMDTVYSDAATLTVTDRTAETGDTTHLLLYLAIGLMALALALVLWRRERRKNERNRA